MLTTVSLELTDSHLFTSLKLCDDVEKECGLLNRLVTGTQTYLDGNQ